MAKWENLKNAVAAVVKTNGNKEITGANMQAVLNSIINAVGGNAGFAGIATPTTNPGGIPDGPTFYITTQGGTYSYFPTDGQGTPATIQDGVISVLYNQGNGLWVVSTTPMSIADGSVTTGKLATGAVTGAKIADGAVGTDKIANGAVDTAKIAEHTIRWENMDQGAVDKNILQDDAVTESKIKDGAVTEYKLGNNSVSTRSIKDGAVITNKLYNGAVTGEKIANETITGAKLADGTVTGEKIANGTIDNEKIADSGIRTENLEDESITTNKIEDGAVTTGKIANKAVTKGKLGDDVVAVLDEIDNKANIDGFYDTMGVGTARNLLGKTSVVDTFFRKTIGIGVVKGNGYVNGVRGNSVAWKQQAPLITSSNFILYRWQNGTISVVDGIASITITNYDSAGYSIGCRFVSNIPIISGHKYFYSAFIKTSKTMSFGVEVNNYVSLLGTISADGNFHKGSVIVPSIRNTTSLLIEPLSNFDADNNTYSVKNIELFDLTAIGIDNLSTTEEVEAWLAANVGEADYYAYDAGSLLNAKMTSIKSTGTNIGAKTKDISITGITGNHLGTRSTIFPNGMRGVGNGYDEISGNSAIVRIASVKVSELEWVDVENNVFVANIPTRKYGNGIIVICDKYASQPRGVDKGIYAHTITDSVLVTDTAYQSVAEFKAAMGDATILFELAEPIEYTDLMDEQDNDFSLPIGIEVEPLGTLETLPQNTEGEALTMCAPTISMQFSIDAAKILTDELPNEYRTNADDKANWQKFLAIMNDKLGSAMGGTISVDDAAVGHGLDFTFAAAQAENNRDVEPIEE